jgi:hypothetical protein
MRNCNAAGLAKARALRKAGLAAFLANNCGGFGGSGGWCRPHVQKAWIASSVAAGRAVVISAASDALQPPRQII